MEENINPVNNIDDNKNDLLKKDKVSDELNKTEKIIDNNVNEKNKDEIDLNINKNLDSEIKIENTNAIEKLNKKNDDDDNLNNKKDSDSESKNDITNDVSKEIKLKPKKELPIEKKPFKDFINDHLIPSLVEEFKQRGLEIENINLKNTFRPIAGDKCWVLFCEIKNTCNFWLSFEKEDITSLKSISLCKSSQNPSVIESFLIDEKRITLLLIISRVLQRLNGQKLIRFN